MLARAARRPETVCWIREEARDHVNLRQRNVCYREAGLALWPAGIRPIGGVQHNFNATVRWANALHQSAISVWSERNACATRRCGARIVGASWRDLQGSDITLNDCHCGLCIQRAGYADRERHFLCTKLRDLARADSPAAACLQPTNNRHAKNELALVSTYALVAHRRLPVATQRMKAEIWRIKSSVTFILHPSYFILVESAWPSRWPFRPPIWQQQSPCRPA